MNIKIEQNLHRLIVVIDGPLDVMSAPAFLNEIGRMVTREVYNLIIDMSRVTLIDTAGTSALVSLLRQVRPAGGVVALTHLSHAADVKLRLRNLDSIFEIYPDSETALMRL